jgi:hypothetical protein
VFVLMPGPEAADFLAGFAQAEAHFGIVEQNGGQSIACRFAIALRDDDRNLLAELQDVTRLGSVVPLPSRRTSAPQTSWVVTRRDECLKLAELFEQHRLYGRKGAEVAIWDSAVRAWNDGSIARERMRQAAGDIARCRAYSATGSAVDITVPSVGEMRHFLGAFLTGDGHFSLSKGRASMTLKQRADESPLLRAIRDSTGLGNVYVIDRDAGNPYAAWIVSGTHTCRRLAGLLEGTIRGKKAAELDVWVAALDAMATQPRGRGAREIALDHDRHLKELRQYRPPVGRLRRPSIPRVTRPSVLAALAEFATEHDGPLDAPTYASIRRERHPEWPTRNTVARHFGGWYAALEAAGLADRAARTADRYANQSRIKFDLQREAQRARVLASVRRCVAELGRVPRAMEYFRWRLANEPDTPTQATVYNVFRGGWPAVVGALSAAPGPARS